MSLDFLRQLAFPYSNGQITTTGARRGTALGELLTDSEPEVEIDALLALPNLIAGLPAVERTPHSPRWRRARTTLGGSSGGGHQEAAGLPGDLQVLAGVHQQHADASAGRAQA